MAPSNIYGGYYGLTPPTLAIGYAVYANPCGPTTKKVETKKQRIARLAKEKMLASWNMHHQNTPTIIEVIQICKPRHLNYLRNGFKK